jgi:hypothetical protein
MTAELLPQGPKPISPSLIIATLPNAALPVAQASGNWKCPTAFLFD